MFYVCHDIKLILSYHILNDLVTYHCNMTSYHVCIYRIIIDAVDISHHEKYILCKYLRGKTFVVLYLSMLYNE